MLVPLKYLTLVVTRFNVEFFIFLFQIGSVTSKREFFIQQRERFFAIMTKQTSWTHRLTNEAL